MATNAGAAAMNTYILGAWVESVRAQVRLRAVRTLTNMDNAEEEVDAVRLGSAEEPCVLCHPRWEETKRAKESAIAKQMSFALPFGMNVKATVVRRRQKPVTLFGEIMMWSMINE